MKSTKTSKTTEERKATKADRTRKAAKRAPKTVTLPEAVPVAEMVAEPLPVPAPEPVAEVVPEPESVVAEPVAASEPAELTLISQVESELALAGAEARVLAAVAELNEARAALKALKPKTTSGPKAPRVKTPAMVAHGNKSWEAPNPSQPEGGCLWRKFKSPEALAAKVAPVVL